MISGRKPGLGAIIVLIVGLILLVSGSVGDGEDPKRRKHGNATATQPNPGRHDRTRDRTNSSLGPAAGTPATVTRVVDGDTVEVALPGGEEDVRYIGIDTPESVAPGQPVECFGKRASALNERLVESVQAVLVFDDERRDQYGRLLAYVYVGDLFVNAELVREGFARTLAISPNTDHAELFDRLERRAGNAGRGLWGACGP